MKKLVLTLLILSSLSAYAQSDLCVNLYYDRDPASNYWMGKTYATLTQNLLGHFPEYQQRISPIDLYKKGEIDECQASIYIGSYFNNILPADFIADYANTKSNVALIGYNIWQLGDTFQEKFGYSYSHLSTANTEKLDGKGRPSFLKNIHYKGEVFFKYGEWNREKVFVAPFEQSILAPLEESKSEVLAWAENPVTREKAPYILRSKNYFYVADVPLSFMHEADRYMVFADVLFDILGAAPKHNGKYAYLRVEDIHPLVPLKWLFGISNILKKEKVPLNVSLIPIFYDPLKEYDRADHETVVTMDRNVSFMSWINQIKSEGANFLWHGVTHQYKSMKNPHSAVSGDDFEFFDAVGNKPIAEDSVSYVLNKLDDGLDVLARAGITPRIWLMPHYQASALDYIIFGEVFAWNIGRAIYYNHSAHGVRTDLLKRDSKTKDDKRLWYETRSAEGKQLRRDVFANLKVNYESNIWSGQMFPYEIYGDVHGQRLIPENLGNSQPFVNEHVSSPRTKEDIVADAKRNLVLRDVWASFFYHPFLLVSYEEGGRGTYPGDPSELLYIIQELKKLGYDFLDINKFMDKNTKPKRSEPLYKDSAP